MTLRIVTRTIVIVAVLLASAAASAQPAAQAVQKQQGGAAALQGFSITLVIGDLQGATAADTVPPAARRALSDMKDFLPYKSYRLVDTAWILGTPSGRMSTTRLGGPGNEQYEVSLVRSAGGPTAEDLQVTFQLRQSDAVDDGSRRASLANREIEQLKATRADLAALISKLKAQSADRQAEMAKALERLAETEQRIVALEGGAAPMPRTVTLINTGFTMQIGETVVVGTSRVQGDKALIALLTAVPRTTK